MDIQSHYESNGSGPEEVADRLADNGRRYSQFLAQSLNNKASIQISNGNYDEAISDLSYALDLSTSDLNENGETSMCPFQEFSLGSFLMVALEKEEEQHFCLDVDRPADIQQPERSSFCSENTDRNYEDLDDCVTMEDNDESTFVGFDAATSNMIESGGSHRNQRSSPLSRDKAQELISLKSNEDNEHKEGFIYSCPLCVNSRCIAEGHNLGLVLPVMILFNIAIAHHLKAISLSKIATAGSTTAMESFEMMQQASKFYHLAYELQRKKTLRRQQHTKRNSDCWNEEHVSMRFMMLITNNLGQIHRFTGNPHKQTMCLQHLLGAMLYMFHNCDRTVLTQKELDRFFDNLAPVLGTKRCAPAA
uniref:Uncharacterized protein n=1 Tax=Pseudo-nitzschia multistriata TaxID=183589 RepID=A0A448ZDK5_9STRA